MRYAWVGEQLYAAEGDAILKYAGAIRDNVILDRTLFIRIDHMDGTIIESIQAYKDHLIVTIINPHGGGYQTPFTMSVYYHDLWIWSRPCDHKVPKCDLRGVYITFTTQCAYTTGQVVPIDPWWPHPGYNTPVDGYNVLWHLGNEMRVVDRRSNACIRKAPIDPRYDTDGVARALVANTIIIYTGFGHAYREKGILYANDAAVSPKGRYFVDWDARGHFSVQSLMTPHLDCIRPLLAQRLGADVARLVTHLL